MYTITQILAAAGIVSETWTKGNVTARLTAGHQLIGTYADLTKFRTANQEYTGWDVHHIFEALDVERLGLTRFSPAYQQQICVLLPAKEHHRMNSVLRHRNPTKESVKLSELESDYHEVYGNVENYCDAPGGQRAIAEELFNIFRSVFTDLSKAAHAAEIANARSALQRLENKIRSEKAWHKQLVLDSSPNALAVAGMVASSVNPLTAAAALVNPANRQVFGGAVRALNRVKTPPLSIWAKAEAAVGAGFQDLSHGNVVNAMVAIAAAEGYFKRAELEVRNWRSGMEVAGRHAELVIAAAAITASLIAVSAFAVEAIGGVAVVGGATGTSTGATAVATETATGSEIVQGIKEGVYRIATASDVAGEQQAEEFIRKRVGGLIVEAVEEAAEEAPQKVMKLVTPR
jgi:hypothetical protein